MDGVIPERFFLVSGGTHSRTATSRNQESNCPSVETLFKDGFTELIQRVKHVGATTATRASDIENRSILRSLESEMDRLLAIVEEIRENMPRPIFEGECLWLSLSRENISM